MYILHVYQGKSDAWFVESAVWCTYNLQIKTKKYAIKKTTRMKVSLCRINNIKWMDSLSELV